MAAQKVFQSVWQSDRILIFYKCHVNKTKWHFVVRGKIKWKAFYQYEYIYNKATEKTVSIFLTDNKTPHSMKKTDWLNALSAIVSNSHFIYVEFL